ncbi:TonB-dependent receptor [Paracoccus caeni]|nr:TonB-dependent receptor [Paracoccus caeni]
MCTSAAVPLAAQPIVDQAEPIELDTITLTADQADALSGPVLAFPSTQTTLSGDTVALTNKRTQRDLSQAIPNVTGFDAGGNRMTTFTVRGLREPGYQSTPGVFPALSYYIDDVPALTTLARASVFTNVDSITVLKGPQNTAFGDSRPGGAIDIRTTEPTDETTGYIGIGAGNHAMKEVQAGISTPLGNDIYLSFDGIWHDRDGFYDNIATGDSYGDKRALAGKARLTWRPSSDTQLDLFLQHERFSDQTDPFIPLSQLRTDPHKVSYNDPGHEDIGQDLIALRARQSFDGFDMLAVTSYRRSTWEFLNDGDMSAGEFDPSNPFSRVIGYTDEEVRSFTQEFRLKSNDDTSRLKWSAGLFAADTDLDVVPGYFLHDGTESLVHANTSSRDLAVFGELRYAIDPTIEIAGGLRYQISKRDASNDLTAPYVSSGDDSYHALLPSVSITWSPTNDLTAFAKYSRGFRAGGFNAHKFVTDPSEYEFESETSDNFELGFRSAHLQDRLQLSGSVFYARYDDYQVLNQLNPNVFAVNNAERVNSYGAEIEAQYELNDSLRLYGGVGVTHAEYDSFSNGYGNWDDKKVPFIPRYTVNYGVEYSHASGFFTAVQGRLTGEYQLNDANTLHQGSAHVVDAQLGYRKGNYEVVVFGQNIFDKRYVANLYDFSSSEGAAMGSLGEAAHYGVRVKYRF